MIEQITTELLKYGLPGLVILVEGAYIWYLTKRINKITDDRVEDSKDSTAANTQLATAIEKLTDRNSQKMDILKDAVKDLKYQIETLKDLSRSK